MQGGTDPNPSCGLSVLVVEDEFLIAMDIESMLTANGHEVVGVATSVPLALRLLEEVSPNVAVIDVNLRGQCVRPVAERLQERSVPFVLSSAHTFRDNDGSDVLADAANIGKPVSEKALLEALHRAVAVS